MQKKKSLLNKVYNKNNVNKKIEVLNDYVARGNDLNKTAKKEIYNYKGEDYKIGIWLWSAKYGIVSQELNETLKKLGFKFATKIERCPSKLKIEILLDLLSSGRDVNSIKSTETHIYNGKEYHIGQWIASAKHYNVDQEFKAFLTKIGYSFEYKPVILVPKEKKLEILSFMISQGIDPNTLKLVDTFCYNNVEYKVGMWMNEARTGFYKKDFLDQLRQLGISTELKVPSVDTKLKIISHMLDQNIDLQKFRAVDTYIYDNKEYNVGAWLHSSRTGIASKKFIAGLKALGVNIDRKNQRIPTDLKIEILSKLIEQGIDINNMKSTEWHYYKDVRYDVGGWLSKARKGQTSKDFIERLGELGFNFEKRYDYCTPKFKLEVLRDYKRVNPNSCNLRNDATYEYKGKLYNIGMWLMAVKRGIITDKQYIAELNELGFDTVGKKRNKYNTNSIVNCEI